MAPKKAKPGKQRRTSARAFALGIVIVAVIGAVLIFSSTNFQGGTVIEPDSAGNAEVRTLPDGTRYIVNPDELLSGGPPKGGIGFDRGIPALDEPKFESADIGWLTDDDLVLGLDYNGVSKAYPLQILNWHEIVNDFAGSDPVLITYCPLCRTGIAFDPVIDGERVRFGTSGKLWNSDLVMYDEATGSYWSQLIGRAIVGPMSGTKLEQIPLDTVRWSDWRDTHPDTLVLSRDTGIIRNYDSNPYALYGSQQSAGFGVDFTDTRLLPKQIVFGVEINGTAKAYEKSAVRGVGEIRDTVGGEEITVRWDEELNTVQIFDSEGGRINSFGHYWFAWAEFFPDTELFS